MGLNDLRGIHPGTDIWVLGSGATLSHVDPTFFNNKIVVATNLAAHGLRLTPSVLYVHSHYHENIAFQRGIIEAVFVTPEGDRGFGSVPEERHDDVVYYPHYPTGRFEQDRSWHPEGLIVGSSSIHGAIHLAAYLGAANIILAGADCGTLDGATNYEGYKDEHGNSQSGDLLTTDAQAWLARWDMHLRWVKASLRDEYGVNIHSLNPFVNPNMEGHAWRSFAGQVN